jgi:hypothetical protein
METVVGVFASRDAAQSAARSMRSLAFSEDQVQLLLPEAGEREVETVPTDETESPGVAEAIGAVVGAASGGAVGLGLGAAVAGLLVPGVGTVTAVGLAAAGLFGAAGAAGGAAAAEALEEKTTHGLPRDEIYLYEDALAHGHSIVFVLARDEAEADRARAELERQGAESIDAARERWWVGLRDVEREHYEKETPGFSKVEPSYRAGFAAGMHPDATGDDEAMRRRHDGGRGIAHPDAFRRGYERGRERRQTFREAGTPVGRS